MPPDFLKLTRRNFIKLGGLGMATGSLTIFSSCKKQNTNMLQGENFGTIAFLAKSKDGEEYKQQNYRLIVLNLDSGKHLSHDLDFKSHSITLHPKIPYLAFLSSKGPEAGLVDLNTGKILVKIDDKSGRRFNGHAAFLSDGETLISSETKEMRGLLTFRNSKTLEIVREVPSHGRNPHMLQLFESEQIIIACNADRDEFSGVCYINLETGALVKRIDTFNEGISPAHCHYKNRKLFIAGTEFKLGHSRLLYIDETKSLHHMMYPAEIQNKFKAELFSISSNTEGNIICSISPNDNYTCFWNFNSGKFIKAIKFENPQIAGLTIDQQYFYVVDNNGAHFISHNNLEIDTEKSRFKFEKNFEPYGHQTLLENFHKLPNI